jgi:hypothetical protein
MEPSQYEIFSTGVPFRMVSAASGYCLSGVPRPAGWPVEYQPAQPYSDVLWLRMVKCDWSANPPKAQLWLYTAANALVNMQDAVSSVSQSNYCLDGRPNEDWFNHIACLFQWCALFSTS